MGSPLSLGEACEESEPNPDPVGLPDRWGCHIVQCSPKLHLQSEGHPILSELLSSLWPPKVGPFYPPLYLPRVLKALLEHYKSENVQSTMLERIKGRS